MSQRYLYIIMRSYPSKNIVIEYFFKNDLDGLIMVPKSRESNKYSGRGGGCGEIASQTKGNVFAAFVFV